MTDKEVEDFGYYFTVGAMRKIVGALLAWLFLYSMFCLFTNPMDDSDTSFFNRSDLKVHVDAKTGIEYLSDGNGGLIRRELK